MGRGAGDILNTLNALICPALYLLEEALVAQWVNHWPADLSSHPGSICAGGINLYNNLYNSQ